MFRCRAFVVTLAIGGAFGVADSIAADLPQSAPGYAKAPVMVPVHDWTGFYLGINGGYGSGSTTVSYAPNDPVALAGTCAGVGGGTCIPSAASGTHGAIAGGVAGLKAR